VEPFVQLAAEKRSREIDYGEAGKSTPQALQAAENGGIKRLRVSLVLKA